MNRLKNMSFYEKLAIVFIVTLCGFALLNIALPDEKYSVSEKRNLTQMPELTFSALTDGSFMDSFDDYETDQFAGRSKWMTLKTGVERLLGKDESEGVYLCKKSFLMEKFEEPDTELLNKTTSEVKKLAEDYPDADVWFMLVPTNISVNDQLLPAFAVMADQDEYIDSFYDKLGSEVNAIDVRDIFEENKNDVQLYYRTDHHWTTDAAYLAYTLAASEMNLSIGTYKYGLVTDEFSGSLVAESGFTVSKKDEIKVYMEDDSVDYVVTYNEEKTRSASCYQTEYLESDDPYQIFFGGNHSQVTIDTDSDSSRTLLILKDSYANCFIPFLLSGFRKITVIDPRYYYGSLDELIQQNEYTDICFLYNASTLSEDNNLYAVLENRQSQ